MTENPEGIDPFLLLALFSLKVVQEQYTNLVLMQTNRDYLGDHWRKSKSLCRLGGRNVWPSPNRFAPTLTV